MTALILLLHAAFSAATGWALLRLAARPAPWLVTLVVAMCLGVYVESLAISVLLFSGVGLAGSTVVWGVVAAGLIGFAWWRARPTRPIVAVRGLRWYEWVFGLLVLEIAVFGVWQLAEWPVYFWDNMTHWSGRARSLYGGVNWSLSPESPVFLAKHIGHEHYPLAMISRRAVSATLCGGWSDLIARFDSLLWYGLAVSGTWLAAWELTKTRWLAAGCAFAVGVLPLHGWHVAAGYVDIGVEAYAVVALLMFVRREWFWAGVMTAGTAWTKNEGLALYVPAMLLAAFLVGWERGVGVAWKSWSTWRPLALCAAGVATLAPWLIFKAMWGLGVSPNQEKFGWQDGALGLFLEKVFLGPTHMLLWPFVVLMLAVCAGAMLRDAMGRALWGMLVALLGALIVVFCGTGAYAFLENEMTIHRSMMQLAAVAVVVVGYGVYLSGMRADARRTAGVPAASSAASE